MVNKRNLVVGTGAIALVGIIGAAALNHKITAEASVTPVDVVSVAPGSADSTTMAEGVITPLEVANVNVLPSTTARVDHVFVNIGDHVEKGQIMAELNNADENDNVEERMDYVARSQAQYELALNPHRPESFDVKQSQISALRDALSNSEANLAALMQSVRPEQIQKSKDNVAALQTKVNLDTVQLTRDTQLASKDLLPRAQIDIDQATLTEDQEAVDGANQDLKMSQEGPIAAQIDASRDTVAENKEALQQALISYKVMEQGDREQQLAVSRASLDLAQVNERHAAMLSDRRFVRSPITGTVIDRNVNAGEVATPGNARTDTNNPSYNNIKALFVVQNDTQVEFQANVDQMYYESVRVGQTADVYVESMPGRSFKGVISRFNPLINSDTGGANATKPLTFQLWVRLDNSKHQFITGQTGYVKLSNRKPGLVVPQSSVTAMTLGQGMVYVASNGTVHIRSIRFDANSNGEIHILSGVQQGEEVVVNPDPKLRDGSQIDARPAPDSDFSQKA